MSNRIKELEKEIALTRELLELRAKLDNPKSTTVLGSINQGIYTGSVKFGNTDLRGLGNIQVGKVEATSAISSDTTYKNLKYGDGSKVDTKSQWTETSEQMWKGIKTPSYQEGRGPCECEYTTE